MIDSTPITNANTESLKKFLSLRLSASFLLEPRINGQNLFAFLLCDKDLHHRQRFQNQPNVFLTSLSIFFILRFWNIILILNNFLPSVFIKAQYITAYRDFQRKKGSLSTALCYSAKIAIPIK